MEKGRIKRKGLRAKGEGFFLENEKKKISRLTGEYFYEEHEIDFIVLES